MIHEAPLPRLRRCNPGGAQVWNVVDVFAGCGGLSAGLHRTGAFRTIAAVEADAAAAATFDANFVEARIHLGDVAEWLSGAVPVADVVVGGPPCQGFSLLGRRDPGDPRSALWSHYVDTVVRTQPSAFVLENVPQFLRSPQFFALQKESEPGGRLAAFALEAWVLNSNDHGIGQTRKRAIVVGRRRELPPLGAIPPSDVGRTLKDEIGHARRRVYETELPERRGYSLGTAVNGPYRTAELHITRNISSVVRARIRCIPPGGSRLDLPDRLSTPGWRKHTEGAGDVMGRLRWDRPAVTIRTEFFKPEKGRFLHPDQDRPLTHYEAARLQGFDDDFVWHGTKTDIARQIGNAVPVPLAEAVGRRLAQWFRAVEPTPTESSSGDGRERAA